MIIKTKNFEIKFDSTQYIDKNTKFIGIPRSVLTFHSAPLFFPDPSTMRDETLASIYFSDPACPVEVGSAIRNPADQPNKQVGMMVALYKAIAAIKKSPSAQLVTELVAELDEQFKSNQYLARLKHYWDHKYIDAPEDVALMKPASKKGKK